MENLSTNTQQQNINHWPQLSHWTCILSCKAILYIGQERGKKKTIAEMTVILLAVFDIWQFFDVK